MRGCSGELLKVSSPLGVSTTVKFRGLFKLVVLYDGIGNAMRRTTFSKPQVTPAGQRRCDGRGSAWVSQSLLVVLLCLMANFDVHAAVGPEVGTVKKLESFAVGAETAIVGAPVRMNDALRTGPKGRLQVTFRDGTTLTLGENARATIDRYVYNPDKSTGELALETGVGASVWRQASSVR